MSFLSLPFRGLFRGSKKDARHIEPKDDETGRLVSELIAKMQGEDASLLKPTAAGRPTRGARSAH